MIPSIILSILLSVAGWLIPSLVCRHHWTGRYLPGRNRTKLVLRHWTRGWSASPPPLPTNIPTGGPGGSSDRYLRVSDVEGSRVELKRAGNYLTAGVNAISMDLNSLGATDLSLRLLVEDPIAGPATNQAISTNAVVLRAGSGWTSVLFHIFPGDLTAFCVTVTGALSDATFIRLFHSPTVTFHRSSLHLESITSEPSMCRSPRQSSWSAAAYLR
jgi:hypothetical protein